MTGAATKERFPVLDGIRGVAAIAVMLDHFMSEEIHLFGHTLYPFAQSAVAVDLFFMLSGFVLAHSYGERVRAGMPLKALLARRVVRLYPAFVVGTGLGLIALLLLVGTRATSFSLGQSLESAAVNLLFLPFFSTCSLEDMKIHHMATGPLFPADTPTWTLFFEMIGTVQFIGLARLRTKALCLFTALAFAIFIVYGVHIGLSPGREAFNPSVGWSETNFLGGFLRIAFGLGAGMLLHHVHRWRPEIVRRLVPDALRRPWIVYGLLLALLANPIGFNGVVTAVSLVTMIPILLLAAADPALTNKRTESISRLFGALSYPIFCLHYPIGRLILIASHGHPMSNPAFTTIAAATSILSAYAAARWLEPLCRTWLGGWLLDRPRPPTVAV
ncbi:acyltransferase [Rhizobium sp. FKL33]|uniref:acyltransferase family protein n=1 Tax=Rhizobium sp. FKL33 TaxID=2562307 RepID=UPI0010BF7A53|nr:acyltransferase [Rhizobium sp. FKL33]